MDTPEEDCFEQMVLRELLAEREVLIDLQFYTGLCELFSLCPYPHTFFALETVQSNSSWPTSLSTEIYVLFLQQSFQLETAYETDSCHLQMALKRVIRVKEKLSV